MRSGSRVYIRGTVSPNHAGQTVTVHYKRGSGSYRRLSTPTLSSTSTYSTSIRLSTRGYYYFHTHFSGDPTHAASVSSSTRVRVY